MSESSEGRSPRPEPADGAQTTALPDGPLLALLLKHQRTAWLHGARVPVEAYLAEQPAVQADTNAVLDLIYNEILLREEIGEAARFDDYLGRFPELAEELKLQFDVETAIQNTSPIDAPSDPTIVVNPSRAGPIASPNVHGYEILGELGRGGMGVVYKARQLRLNRIVALKMILSGDHASPDAGMRFQAEAESVARLHHPHIVQIFAYGDSDGRPYFEMEYVAGGSLAARLDGTPRPPHESARLVETLARAIHEAHRLGIVHRDLKPANILLTADGVPKIADFGLAKLLDVANGPSGTQIVGSPSYMAPEQAGQSSSSVGPAADVYSLGAILYELLAGRPPFQAATVLETLTQLRLDEPISPARLRPKLPRDLVTICVKCLAKEPSRRYASSIELADDLKRFQSGQTILARPVGRLERVVRWCRREPLVASLAVALVAGLIGVAMQWLRAESHLKDALYQQSQAEESRLRQKEANRSLQLANDAERTARQRAQNRFDAALKALEEFESITNDAALLREPQFEPLRGKLLRKVLGIYKDLQASLEEDASSESRLQLSVAYARIASVSWELGLHEEALASHRQALALVEKMAAAAPDDRGLQAALATCHTRIGFTLRTRGDSAHALRPYELAREIQERLVHDAPFEPRHQEALSWTLSNIGVIEQDLGRPASALHFHQRAIAIHQSLVSQQPQNARYRSDLAWCWRYLCLALVASGDSARALELVERAATVHEELVAADRGALEFRWRLARCLDEVGRIRSRSGREADAAGPLERSAELYETVARDNPVPYRLDVARNQLNLAFQRAATGRPQDALASIRSAEDLMNRSSSVWPMLFYDLACAYSRYSLATQGNLTFAADRESCRRQAVVALRKAVTAGYCDLAQIQADVLLEPLHSCRDFQAMVMDLTFPSDPFQP
jgi:eukaryotic-like serine/threonine-protein kinase